VLLAVCCVLCAVSLRKVLGALITVCGVQCCALGSLLAVPLLSLCTECAVRCVLLYILAFTAGFVALFCLLWRQT
jgi:hypothetical protein